MAFVSGRKCSWEARAGLGFLSPLIPKLTTQIMTERGCSEWGQSKKHVKYSHANVLFLGCFLKFQGYLETPLERNDNDKGDGSSPGDPSICLYVALLPFKT